MTPQCGKAIREYCMRYAIIEVKATTEEDSVYSTYYDFSSAVEKPQSHQTLAINRGEREGFLKVAVRVDESVTRSLMYRRTQRTEAERQKLTQEQMTPTQATISVNQRGP